MGSAYKYTVAKWMIVFVLLSVVLVVISYFFRSFDSYDRLHDKLPPGATHVSYLDGPENSSVTFDLYGHRYLMWYSGRGGTLVVEISDK